MKPDSTNLQSQVAVMASQVTRMSQDINEIKGDVRQIRSDNENHYVTKEEFEPVRRIVYGMVTIILVAVLGAIIALVVRR